MMSNEDLCSLAKDLLAETPHGFVAVNIMAELAAGVIRLHKEQEWRAQVFEKFLVDHVALSELRDFWRARYYKDIPVNKTTGNQQTVNQQRSK